MGVVVGDPNIAWESIDGLHDAKQMLRERRIILPMPTHLFASNRRNDHITL
jgi:SpoVK/Ycf46/Vps4 family AAA+-type ATPase